MFAFQKGYLLSQNWKYQIEIHVYGLYGVFFFGGGLCMEKCFISFISSPKFALYIGMHSWIFMELNTCTYNKSSHAHLALYKIKETQAPTEWI